MTGSQIIDLANTLIVETVFDVTSANDLIFLNVQKNKIEQEKEWEWLKTRDRSLTTTAGNNYLSAIDLPSGFLMPLSKYGLYVDIDPFEQVSLEEAERFKDGGFRWYMDYLNRKFYICETIVASKTITLNFIKDTDDITSTGSPVWPKFHERIAYEMAIEYLGGIDYDPVNESKAKMLSRGNEAIRNAMENINNKMAISAMGGRMKSVGEDSFNEDGRVDIYND